MEAVGYGKTSRRGMNESKGCGIDKDIKERNTMGRYMKYNDNGNVVEGRWDMTGREEEHTKRVDGKLRKSKERTLRGDRRAEEGSRWIEGKG